MGFVGRGLGVVVCVVALLAFSPLVQAANEYELNDTRESATGPLKGGTDYTATFETVNDVDWYLFYIKSYSQMDFSATTIGPTSCPSSYTELELLDRDGKYIRRFYPGGIGKTEHLQLTLNPGRYYFLVENDGCTDDQYRFRIDPAASITSSRECGEAIVAKDAIGPQVTKVNEELADNAEDLAVAATGVRKAKKVVRKLGKRRGVSRYTKRAARRRLEAAKNARTRVWREKKGLEGLLAQHQQSIATADSQIATYC